MAQLVVRNVEDRVAEALRLRAQANGRSMEAEVRVILTSAVDTPGQDARADFARAARALRDKLGARGTDSVALLREGRDARL
ncbi:MAG: FitA-like ribbon-helix-helix domain-containing protein [Paracoccaceae bacterium]